MSDSHWSSKITRRAFLRSQAALAVGAATPMAALAATTSTTPAKSEDYYDKLGVGTFLNAAGTYTALSSACMPAEVQAAVAQAAKRWVHIKELQEKAGAYIANRLKCEGCCISAGAASALTLATAACIQAANNCKPTDMPRLIGTPQYPKNEVITQTPYEYDVQMFVCGAKVVVVNSLDEYKQAFNSNTVMTNHENATENLKVSQEDWLAVAHDHGVPCHLDAAADMPHHRKASMEVHPDGLGSGLLFRRQSYPRAARTPACCWAKRSWIDLCRCLTTTPTKALAAA